MQNHPSACDSGVVSGQIQSVLHCRNVVRIKDWQSHSQQVYECIWTQLKTLGKKSFGSLLTLCRDCGEADSASFLFPSPCLSLSCCMLWPTCTMALHSTHEPITSLLPSSTRSVRVLRGAYRNTGSLATVTVHSLPCLRCSFLQKKHTNASQLYWRAQGELGGWELALDKIEVEGVEGPRPLLSCWAH